MGNREPVFKKIDQHSSFNQIFVFLAKQSNPKLAITSNAVSSFDAHKTDLKKRLARYENVFCCPLLEYEPAVTKKIASIKNLSSLLIWHYQLSAKTIRQLAPLRQLLSLDFRNNGFRKTDFALLIQYFPQLSKLACDQNKITDSDAKKISALDDLTCLSVNRNEITDLGARYISKLNNLTSLDISENRITDKGLQDISALGNLTSLNVGSNRITDSGARQISGIVHLTYLDISHNNIRDSGVQHISSLSSLEVLDVSANSITERGAKALTDLRSLCNLDLSTNPIRDISFCSNFTSLQCLNISATRVTDLTPLKRQILNGMNVNLDRWGLKGGISVAGCPLVHPPIEIVEQGHEAVVNYFKSLEDTTETVDLFEAKLLVVGYGDVGKTVLKQRLMHPGISEEELKTKTTEGIDIDTWPVATDRSDNFITHFWDFGGQEIYHATHQFFLTNRSLYLFVWEARTDDDLLSFDYWLNTISILSNGAPILVIQNKIDERRKAVNQTKWTKLFPNIVGFYDISALKGDNTWELQKVIRTQLDKLDHIGTSLPKVWQDIRDELSQIHDNCISFTEYKSTCDRHGLDEKQASFLSDYFHDLGVFLHFKTNPILRNAVFLKPEWATNAVYKVTDNKTVQENFGWFKFSQLADIWDDRVEFPETCFVDLIELMKDFELCFELPQKQAYIIPELLRTEQPNLPPMDEQNALRFQFEYDFMPAGVMTRFIVKVHDLIEDKLYWKDGVVLKFQDATARVMKTDVRRIQLWIEGHERTTLLGMIRRDMREINKPFHNLDVRELVPCVCHECQDANEVDHYFFQYEKELLRARNKGKRTVECRKSFEDVRIDELLGAIGNHVFEGMSKETRVVKLFVASSGELKAEREQIELLVARENRRLMRRQLFSELVLWEELSHSFRGNRIQDYFTEEMLKCDVVLFLFYTKAGQFTLEEFKKAYEAFKGEFNPSHLYVFFKDTPIAPSLLIDQDIRKLHELKNRIEENEQIYIYFKSPDELENRLKKQIDLLADELGTV